MLQAVLDIIRGLAADPYPRQVFDNNLLARLTTDIETTTEAIHYTALTSGWPAVLDEGRWFSVTFSDATGRVEIVKVTGITPMTMTVERGFDGTTPQIWQVDTTIVSARVTAETMSRTSRVDELGRFTQVQDFQAGFYARADGRFEERLSIGLNETADLELRRVGGEIALATSIPLIITSEGLETNGLRWPDYPDDLRGRSLYVDPATDFVVGRPLEWYIGAFATPPTTLPDGGPLEEGMVYYDTVMRRPRVWSGTAWGDFFAAGPGVTQGLIYTLASPSDGIAVGLPDDNGNAYVLDSEFPESVRVHLNGVLLTQDAGSGGDYLYDDVTGAIDFAVTLPIGSTVQVDLLISPDKVVDDHLDMGYA